MVPHPRREVGSGNGKPRVLLVDDHPVVLARLSAVLAADFDVVGTAADGRQALDVARRLDPDAIVLDINMPRFDGFQTMRALGRARSRAPVIFLSMHDDDDHVSEAFRLGGRGYVLKPRMLSDLVTALDHVLGGRLFMPSLPSLCQVTAHGHALNLHSNEQSFADALAALFDLALQRGDATCLVATAQVRDGVTQGLHERGWDVGPSTRLRRYRTVDAHAALDGLLRDGLPDATRLAQIVEDLDEYRRDACEQPSSSLTVAGKLSGLLIEADNVAGALALERQWTTLTAGRPFLTVCGYATSCFHDHASDAWSMTAAEHSAVSHAGDD
jgi:DNA-binding NarL/FixJ family response regulator